MKIAKRMASASSSTPSQWLVDSKIAPSVMAANYALRGPLFFRAEEIKRELAREKSGADDEKSSSKSKYPFAKVISCNLGNPQALGQIPLTFNRQVLSGVLNPSLLEFSNVFPADVKKRVKSILSMKGDSLANVGAYTHSQGYRSIRETVARFIEARDTDTGAGSESKTSMKIDPDDIFLSDGASSAIKSVLQCLVSRSSDGIMLPLPQYPLYSACVTLYRGTAIYYPLDEASGWSLEMKGFEEALTTAKKADKDLAVKAVVVINPGNPTGQVLSRDNIREIIRFCHRNSLMILADEVYQENIYDEKAPFVSFHSVLHSLGDECAGTELISFHSCSKGILGECGIRGGYMHLTNISDSGKAALYKLASICLCPNVTGQVCVDLMCRSPQEADESFSLYSKEHRDLHASLCRRAKLLSESLNKIEGIDSQIIQGAMYAFPTIQLPAHVVKKAEEAGVTPDQFYCMGLLEKTGMFVVPGKGFGQKEGSFHFRTTLLPPESELKGVVDKLAEFHAEFVRE